MDAFTSDIWEILMIKWCGINEGANILNGPAWTLSSMCIVGFFIWGCLYYWGDKFLRVLMPLSLCVGFAVWRHLDSAAFDAWVGFTTFGTMRAWLVMSLGYYSLQIAKKLRELRLNRLCKLLLTVFEAAAHGLILVLMFYRNTRYCQWFATLLFLVTTAIAVSGHSYLDALLRKCRISSLLGELSFSVFLVHTPLQAMYLWKHDVSAWTYPKVSYIAVVLAVAVVHLYATKAAIWLVSCLRVRLRRTFTEP